MCPELVTVEDVRDLPRTAATRLARAISARIEERDRCALALPAGGFVRPIYDELRRLRVPWAYLRVLFTEERCVPSDHPASAYGTALDHLLGDPRFPSENIRRIEVEAAGPERAAEEYEGELDPPPDVALFELGRDGRLGGLAPDSAAFDDSERRALALEVADKPRRRVLVAPRVLASIDHTVTVAVGADRGEALALALEPGDARAVPGRLVANGTWIVDRAAAAAFARAGGAPEGVHG